MIPPRSPQPPSSIAMDAGHLAHARLEKFPHGLIPQAIGRVAAWATMEHDPNDR